MEPQTSEAITFGAWLKRQRRILDLTRDELGRRAHCSPETIKKIETDERFPSRDLAGAIADAVGIASAARDRFIRFARGNGTVDDVALASATASTQPSQPAPPFAPPPAPLLETKLFFPVSQASWVVRPRLIALLKEGISRPLMVISAAAGCGKTTLAAYLAELDTVTQSAWFSLDADDNNLSRFLTYLVHACRRLRPGVGELALAALQTQQAPATKMILAGLMSELMPSAQAVTWVLVLDDYHVITNLAVHETVAYLLDNLPPHLHLVITSRADPPLSLSRLRARNQLTEIRDNALRFTREEAGGFLNQLVGEPLREDEIAVLETRTEGWIAGLQLAALSLRGMVDRSAFISAFSGSNRYIVDYLMDEVLSRQPPAIQSFLMQTSILDRLCGPLCDALTGQTDGQLVLEELERHNLFMIPLDQARHWYRYHHLFVDVLRHRLKHSQPSVVPQLHRRASDWYDEAGQIEAAVNHALAIPNVEQAATLIEQQGMAILLHRSETILVHRLIDRIPSVVIHARPRLILVYGLTLALVGHFNAIEPLLTQSAAALNTADLPADVGSGLTLLHALMARLKGESARAIELGRMGLKQLPLDPANELLRAGAHVNIGAAYFQLGDYAAGQTAMAEAVSLGVSGGAGYMVLAALEELATVQMRQGELQQARQTIDQALNYVVRSGDQGWPAAGMAKVLLGEMLVELNETEAAGPILHQGISLLQATMEIGLLGRGYVAVARVLRGHGDRETALRTLQHADDWLTQMQIAPVISRTLVVGYRMRLLLETGHLETAMEWVEVTLPNQYPVEEQTWLSYFQRLTAVRILLAQYQLDQRPQWLMRATQLLSHLIEIALTKGWFGHAIEGYVLQGLMRQTEGNLAAARDSVRQAVTLAAPSGYIRIFVDEGEPMRALLADVHTALAHPAPDSPGDYAGARLSAYVGRVLAAFGP